MATDDERRCQDCRFYDERMRWQGDCRRFPPVIDGKHRTTPDNSRTTRLGAWPLVEAGWWCGEFLPTPSPEQSS